MRVTDALRVTHIDIVTTCVKVFQYLKKFSFYTRVFVVILLLIILYLGFATEISRYKCNPYDTRRVHRESDKLCLVEVFRNIASFHGVEGAKRNE